MCNKSASLCVQAAVAEDFSFVFHTDGLSADSIFHNVLDNALVLKLAAKQSSAMAAPANGDELSAAQDGELDVTSKYKSARDRKGKSLATRRQVNKAEFCTASCYRCRPLHVTHPPQPGLLVVINEPFHNSVCLFDQHDGSSSSCHEAVC